jgi:catalase
MTRGRIGLANIGISALLLASPVSAQKLLPGPHQVSAKGLPAEGPARLTLASDLTIDDLLEVTEPAQEPAPMTTPPATAPTPSPPFQPSDQQMVDALYTAFGDHHVRAVHAKGVMAVGVFEPDAAAPRLCKALLFAAGAKPVVVRFSDFTGIPDIPDTVGDANPRGLSIKFSLADGSTADVVSHSFNGFPTATSAEFRELLLAIGAKGMGQAAPLDHFLSAHPIAKTFLATQKPPPESYSTLNYFGVNAFALSDAQGRTTFVRYRFAPVGGEILLDAAALAARGPNYLQTELPERLAKGPVAFEWYAQIAESSDRIDDPSVAWPEGRKLVKLGLIRIVQMAPDPADAEKSTLFDPLNVPDGIAPADPMLDVRHGAYPISFRHRQ